jgi:hypothetical protein
MPKYELSDAIDLFSQQSTNITSLWTVYVVLPLPPPDNSVAIRDNTFVSVVISYITFVLFYFILYHLILLIQALSINLKLSNDIDTCISSDTN